MELFDLRDMVVTVSPQALLIPEFKKIWDDDSTNDKSVALKQLAYVYYISDFKSPYLLSSNPDQVAKLIAKDFMKDEDYVPTSEVMLAIDKYKSLQETPSMRLLSASLSTIHNLSTYLENVNLEERDDRGKPIYKPNDVTGSLSKIGGIVESLTKVREQVEKEITKAGTLRGQRRKGNREDPS